MTLNRVAALYDIHGNLPALDAVLGDGRLAGAELILCGGDVIAGPFPGECLDRLLTCGVPVQFVLGNGDRDVVAGGDEVSRWCMRHLGLGRAAFVEEWPPTFTAEVRDVGSVVFCHATPRSIDEIVTRITPADEVENVLAATSASTIVCGHVHVRYDRQIHPGRRLVNPGSVGMPYEGRPGIACWAWIDRVIELVTTPYDAEAALGAMRATGFPNVEGWLVPALLGEVTAYAATEHFEGVRRAA